MADDKVKVAVDAVARHLVHNTLTTWVNEEDWSDYADLSADDFSAVLARVQQLANMWAPPGMEYEAAYEFLAGRAEA